MTPTFQRQHGVMLLKYSGISFISGAVNHGFFSGERSLWTALVGIVLFVAGAWLEHRDARAEGGDSSLGRTLLWGTALSIGLGFFTGGLQHFPDSPQRSAWVVPLGFAISVVALLAQLRVRLAGPAAAYVLVAGLATAVGSVGAWRWLEAHPHLAEGGHDHGEEAAATGGPTAQIVSRVVEVRMSDRMRFQPDRLRAAAGETLRIVVRNDGQLPHELVIGSEGELRDHAQAMRASAGHSHAHGPGAAITVAPGQTGELVVTYGAPQELHIGCLVPGHWEAGMRGRFDVVATAAQAGEPAPAAAPVRDKGHDHRTHKH